MQELIIDLDAKLDLILQVRDHEATDDLPNARQVTVDLIGEIIELPDGMIFPAQADKISDALYDTIMYYAENR